MLAYLDPQEVEDSFVFDIMPDAPSDDDACDKYWELGRVNFAKRQ